MSEALTGLLVLPLAVLFYASGLLFWPVRRWLKRKQKFISRGLKVTFFLQLACYAGVAIAACFIRLQHFYGWFIFIIEINILFTVANAFVCVRDALRETLHEAAQNKP